MTTTNAELIERIDFDKIMPLPRCSGGHDEQMQNLIKNSKVIAHWNEGDYQGDVATCIQLLDTNEYVIYNDSYGSCSGCDSWEDADDKQARHMCIQLASTAKIFPTLQKLVSFLYSKSKSEDSVNLTWRGKCSMELLNILNKKLDIPKSYFLVEDL